MNQIHLAPLPSQIPKINPLHHRKIDYLQSRFVHYLLVQKTQLEDEIFFLSSSNKPMVFDNSFVFFDAPFHSIMLQEVSENVLKYEQIRINPII